ncbi:MAG: hypothetical protein IID28_13410 [Planctomycetes bacterium]|nr:hypothetical protein [Planctomycetota bacterium]
MQKRIFALTVLIVLAVSTAQADTIHVDAANCPGPGDGSELDPYCSIQTAIDNAVDTDEIVVASGIYFETIDFLGKAITVRSADGPEVTTIDGTGFFHVVQCASDEGRDTVLDGFTITGGDGSGLPYPDNAGGGMAMFESGPTVTNCTFSGNAAWAGGGIFSDGGSPTVTNCTFSLNSADYAGGGMFSDGGSPTVTNCTFIGNTAAVTGGGMSNFHSCPTVTDCIFTGNSAGGGAGGGMYNDGEIPVVTNCTFIENSADVGGGMSNDLSDPTVTNCTFVGNSARLGGGMINYGGSCPTVTNCTFSENTASSVGGGMNTGSGDTPTVINCILWGDSPDEFFGTGTVAYSNIQGGWPGTGNIDAAPMFVDPDNSDFRLQTGSPGIDAGHNWAIAGITDTDLDGNPRFAADRIDFDPGCGIPVVVDMGAYEYQGEPFPVKLGDIDGDGIVGIVDFLALLAGWGPCVEQCCLADLDLDGKVGIVDFLTLLANWDSRP